MQTIADRAAPGQHVTRSFMFTDCEFRDDGPDGWVTFEGVASVVDKPYTVRDMLGEFHETITSGAFDKTLAELGNRTKHAKSTDDTVDEADVALYMNHDYRALPLATVSSGRLTLRANPNLRVKALMNPARPSVQEARHAVNDGDARQMSIGFQVPKGRDKWYADYTERIITEVKLHEASIVWRGANHHTSGAVRSLDALLADLTMDEYSEDEVRRAIAALEALVAPETPAEPIQYRTTLAAAQARLDAARADLDLFAKFAG